MPKRPDPNAIRAGDYLHLQVPPNRYIATGTYRSRVESLAAKRGVQRLKCSIIVIGDDFDDESTFTVWLPITIYNRAPLKAQCFLGTDQFPVGYAHEPNLERRMRESIPTTPKERPRYADN